MNNLFAKGIMQANNVRISPDDPPKNFICFINRFPPELLSYIFQNEAPSDSSSAWPPFEVTVSHVCRHWRDVALSTPSLWTTIVVGLDARSPFNYVSTMLERSRAYLIDIYVNCHTLAAPLEDHPNQDHDLAAESCPSCEADLRYLYSLLIPHIHRWRTIEVSATRYRHMHVFLTLISDPSISTAPRLTTLKLYYDEDADRVDRYWYPRWRVPVLFGGSAPCLTCIAIWSVHVDWNHSWIASASNLTDLELAFHVEPSWTQFATILRSAPALEKISLRECAPRGEPAEWVIQSSAESHTDLDAPIQLLKVTTFVLEPLSVNTAIGLLRKLYLPALRHLVLKFDDHEYADLIREFARPTTFVSSTPYAERPYSLLSRLESLMLVGVPFNPDCYSMLCAPLHNLTTLQILWPYIPQDFIDILSNPCTFPGRGGIWLPRLATLYVPAEMTGEDIRQVVDNRKEARIPLKALYVEGSRDYDLDEEDVEWLKENVETFEYCGFQDDESSADTDDTDSEL